MKKNLIILGAITLLLQYSLIVSAVSVTGKIKELYVNQAGYIALKLDSGFSNELVQAECPNYNGFAGNRLTASNEALKATLISAFTAGHQVRLIIDGCASRWLNIVAVYVTK